MQPDHRTLERVADFLFYEAFLADRHDHDRWLGLWSPDGIYHVPCNDDDSDPETHVALIYDRYSNLEDRIARLKSGYAHAQQPRSRLCRVVANIRIDAADSGLLEARSVCSITAFRRGEQEVFTGHMVHLLRPNAESFSIVRKTVNLVNNDGVIGNLTFIV